ncbi:PREDICTED: 3-ketodihydrosphingosine reductase [Polistes dominula]|uniref:3-dehydrosphinganine reductase n=1 Tax=Polistes dominula TaxID=743375 RepID=A0ABM1JH38_POLDO|nr:PREDICTED: 3-ketodihydrosphingosine reductase [Polistes dominula]
MILSINLLIVISALLISGLIIKLLFYRGCVKSIENKHVVITGGSSGIGKSVAIIAARKGAHVTIIARDVEKLEKAKYEIMQACKNRDTQRVEYLPLDITKDYEEIQKAFMELEKTMGSIYMLINCAGSSMCAKIEDTSTSDLRKIMDLNFFGTYNCIKAVVQSMKTAKDGIIVLTGSAASLLGVYGFSAYCSSKFALRGLAETLSMELTPYNISVTLSLPPDTDTPGFAEEELTKLPETKLISQSSGLVKPEVVADILLKDALNGKYFSTVGLEGFLLSIVCCGMSPFTISEILIQMITMGFIRFISVFYIISFQRIILKCMKTRDMNKKSE